LQTAFVGQASVEAAATAVTRSPSSARRCHLSVLFCDLCDSTALSGLLEAEDYADLLGALRRESESAIAQHGGTVVRLQGDGMLAVFGYPQAREGDGRRAVEAALQLHRAAAALSVPPDTPVVAGRPSGLRLHSGIHAGMVLVQEGDVVIGRLELLGMVPNIAARVATAAGRDEILVSDETLGPDRHCFQTGSQRQVCANGFEGPVACWPIVGRALPVSPFEARTKRGLQPFIGRNDEVRGLEDRLGEVLAGATRQVAISGPPGVGKTRLAEHFMQQAAWKGCLVLKGFCDGELAATPLQPLLHMLRSALGIAADATPAATQAALHDTLGALGLPELAGPLARVVAPAAGNRQTGADDVLSSLARMFAALAARQPLLLFIDDWQWSDAASRQAMAAVCAAAEGSALMVLYSTRGMDSGDATMLQVEVIQLKLFSSDETAASIRSLLPQADPFVAEDIYRYSGGNALYIEELCHSVGHDLPRRNGAQPVAAWLKVLIESRVARLPAAEAALLRSVAVIGTLIPMALLRELTGLEADDPLLQHLASKDLLFLETPDTFRFKHGLTRDVVYESVGLRERRALHLRIANALSQHASGGQDEPHEALAYHFGAAGCLADAAHHAELGGDRAAAMSALDLAKSLYHAALPRLPATELTGDAVAHWLAISSKLALICVFDASRKDLPVFERAVALAREQSDPLAVARAEYWLGYILYALGQAREAVAHCERALLMAGGGGDPLAVQIRATLGQVKAAASDYAGALPLLEDAVAIKRQHRRSSRLAVGLAYSLVCLASVLGDRGDFARAHEYFDEALALLNGARHEIGASIQGWRAVVLTWQGRWADAVAAAQESANIAEQTHSHFQFCQGRATGAFAEWMLAGDARAIAVLEESTQWLQPRESGLFRSLDHGWLAEGWFTLDSSVQARHHAALALRRGRAGDLIGVAMAYRALARDAAERRDFTAAQHYLAEAQRVGKQRDSAHEAAVNQLCAAQMAVSAGAGSAVRQHAEAALVAFQRMGMHWHAGKAQDLLSQA
jgi:class 3 adenylate cyclase/tetratricopeptide (TPR) repeat protein